MKELISVQGLEIKSISCELMEYEVGKRDVLRIETSDQGSKNNTMYKVIYDNNEYLHVGMIEHKVKYKKGDNN